MSSSPSRFTSGITQDASYQPLGQVGVPDPFFYAYYEDDFIPYNAAIYTATLDGGTVAATTAQGPGGRILLSALGVAADFVGLQLTSAAFLLTAGQKAAYLTRLRLPTPATTSFNVGLIQTTTTPSTVTDGIYIAYVGGGTSMTLSVVTGGTVIGTVSIPVAPGAATDIDIGFVVDRSGNINVYAGSGLVGNKTFQYDNITTGPVAKLYASTLTGALTTVLLNPTVEVISPGSTAGVLAVDFQFAGTER